MKVKRSFYIWVFSLVLLLGMVKNGIAATASTSDIAEGDAAWYELTVGSTGVVDVNAWTDGSTEDDDIYISLYDPTVKEVSSGNGYNNKVSITYTTTTTGTFKVRVYLGDAYNGGTRKITIASNYSLSAFNPTSTPTPSPTPSPSPAPSPTPSSSPSPIPTVQPDTTAPAGSISINRGDANTTSTEVTLNLSAT